MLKTITVAFKGIITGLSHVILALVKAVLNVFKLIINAFKSIIVNTYQATVSTGKKVIKMFKPVYSVTFTMYHVIPGMPVQENVSLHSFERGASNEAEAFYNKVVSMTVENKIAPTEVKLKKGKKVIKSKQFGPIEDIKKFRIAA